MRRLIVGSVLAGIVLFFCVLVLIARHIVTIEDVHASNKIRQDFIAASTNMIANKQLRIASNPHHGTTRLFVYGELSEEDKQSLQMLAAQISKNNSNRPVNIEFHAEIFRRTNN